MPGVLGVSRWSNQLTIYADKISTGEHDLKENEMMRAGKRLEPFIAEWCLELMNEEVNGVKFKGRPYGILIRSIEYPWMICTPDWLIREKSLDEEFPAVPFQIKNTMLASDWDEGVPESVLIQCLHEQIVFGSDHSFVGVLLTGNRPRWACIERSDHKDLCKRIIDEGYEFFGKITDRVPVSELKMDGAAHTQKALFNLHPKDNGETVELSGEMMERALMWDSLRLKQKECGRHADRIAAEIKSVMGDYSYGSFPDGSGFSWKHQHKKAETQPRPSSDSRVLRRQKGRKAAAQ